jgi:ATP adenylyltransferase
MLNAFPYAPGHLMVAPRRHLAGIDQFGEEELLELMTLTRRALDALRDAMSPDGFNVGLNLGKVAGAGFDDHVHQHVVPRWDGDNNFMPVIADTRVVSQALTIREPRWPKRSRTQASFAPRQWSDNPSARSLSASAEEHRRSAPA